MTRRSLILVAVLLAACGSGGADPTTTLATGAPPPETTTTTAAPADPAGEDRGGELVGRWEVANYELPDGGGLTNVVGSEPVYLEFGADGTVGYHTGCNAGGTTYAVSGTYYVPSSGLDDTPEGQSIVIGPTFEQEGEGCEGFLGDQDRDLPIDLGMVTRFVFDGDRLLLLDEFLLVEAFRS